MFVHGSMGLTSSLHVLARPGFATAHSATLPPENCHASAAHPSHCTPPRNLATLHLGPGRDILVGGMSALLQNRPDMNTLVGLGATASFGVSCVAAAMPHLGWKTFFEEPAMLLGES